MQELSMELPVQRAYPVDAGRNLVRVPKEALRRLSVTPGDPVKLSGDDGQVAVAKCWRIDMMEDFARVSETIRENASLEIGDSVTIEPCQTESASLVVLEWIDEADDVSISPEKVREELLKVPLREGDQVAITQSDSVSQTRSRDSTNYTKLYTNHTVPDGVVRVRDETKIEIE